MPEIFTIQHPRKEGTVDVVFASDYFAALREIERIQKENEELRKQHRVSPN